MSLPLRAVLGPIRAPFLVLTPACVALGIASAHAARIAFPLTHALLALIGGLLAHVSVNAFNEYLDFRSGLDARTQRTPFSGGSGALPAHPQAAPWALAIALVSLALTVAIGAFFLSLHGTRLLPLGIGGLLLVVAYTGAITRRPLLCLLAPGLGFGPLMVVGTYVALGGAEAGSAWAVSLIPLFQVSNLLLLNQFPDVEADLGVGRRHLPIVIGRPASARVYALFALLAYLSLVGAAVLHVLPSGALAGLLTAPLAWRAARQALQHADEVAALLPAMRDNVLVCLLTPVLIAAGIALG